jgi:hypothetical protein
MKTLKKIVIPFLWILSVISCNNNAETKINNDTLKTDTSHKDKLLIKTLTDFGKFDSVQIWMLGKDTIRYITWKDGFKDGLCKIGWEIRRIKFTYPDLSDSIISMDTAFDMMSTEFWANKKMLWKIENLFGEDKVLISTDTLTVVGNDTISIHYSWFPNKKIKSFEKNVNWERRDSFCLWNYNGSLRCIERYSTDGRLIKGIYYSADGKEIVNVYYTKRKGGDYIFSIKDGKPVK